jgi:hypothetical protein
MFHVKQGRRESGKKKKGKLSTVVNEKYRKLGKRTSKYR